MLKIADKLINLSKQLVSIDIETKELIDVDAFGISLVFSYDIPAPLDIEHVIKVIKFKKENVIKNIQQISELLNTKDKPNKFDIYIEGSHNNKNINIWFDVKVQWNKSLDLFPTFHEVEQKLHQIGF